MNGNEKIDIGWKQFIIRLIEALRWPAAWVAIIFILRQPISGLLEAIKQTFIR